MKKKLTLQEKAFIALKKAIQEVVAYHKKTGRPLTIWQNGKVVKLSSKKIQSNGNLADGPLK